MTRPALRAEGLTLRYPNAAQPVLANFNLTLGAGDIVAVLGPSGVGKSSLLRTLAGLEAPTAGRIQVDGALVTAAHPRVAVAFQDPSLLPWLTLEKNVAFGLDFRRQPKLDRQQRQARIDAAIQQVGLSQARHHYPAQLSGAAVWPILLSTAAGVRQLDPRWLQLARSLSATRWETLVRIIIPGVLGHVLIGVRLAIGILWIVLVPCEMLGVSAGLGYFILDTRDRLAYSELMAMVLLIGALGFLLDAAARLLYRLLIPAAR